MRRYKTFFTLLTLAAVLLTQISSVFAARDETVIRVTEPKNYTTVSAPDGYDESVDWDGFLAALEKAVNNQDTVFDVRAFNIAATDENLGYIYNIVFHTPRLLRVIESYSQVISGNRLSALADLEYNMDARKYAAALAECEDAVTTLLFGIKGNNALSDAEKCLLLHDRLAAWTEYDYDRYLANEIPDPSYCACGALVTGTAVCQGYSYAYQWLLDELGIENYYTVSDAINHGWNMVILDGQAYYTDVTWDDPVRDKAGQVMHNNFLLSFPTFSERHENAADFSGAAVSTLYEDGFWTNTQSEIVFAGGGFYYFADAENNGYRLIRRGTDGTESTVKTFSHKWRAAGGGFYPWQAKLCQYGDGLLYSTPTDIRLYDPADGTETVVFAPEVPDGECIYGFTMKNGVLTAQICGTPNFTASVRPSTVTFSFCSAHKNREMLAPVSPATEEAAARAKYICTDCRAVFTDTLTDHTHIYGQAAVITAATCAAAGKAARICTLCGHTDVFTTPKDADHHTGGTRTENGRAASCTEPGFSGDVFCLGCGEMLLAGTVTAPIPHDYKVSAVTPDCTGNGYTVHVCRVCRDSYLDGDIPALGHADENGDGRCDGCAAALPVTGCVCACRQNGLAGLLYRVRLLFARLLGIEKYRVCDCGRSHW